MNWKDRVRSALRHRGHDLVRHPLGALLRRHAVTLVLDVGASEGYYGAEVRRLGHRGRIVSFEPLADVHARLARRAAPDPLWETRNIALGAHDETAHLHVGREAATSSLLTVLATTTALEPDTTVTHSETVRVHRLDALFDDLAGPTDRVFLKLDAQGAEGAILDGAAVSLGRITVLQIELSFAALYAGQPLAGELLGRLHAAGFALVGLEHGFVDPVTGRLLQADGFFERTDA